MKRFAFVQAMIKAESFAQDPEAPRVPSPDVVAFRGTVLEAKDESSAYDTGLLEWADSQPPVNPFAYVVASWVLEIPDAVGA